jgi:hypothetical protein
MEAIQSLTTAIYAIALTLGTIIVLLLIRGVVRLLMATAARPRETVLSLNRSSTDLAETLVVVAPGLPGLKRMSGALALVKRVMPNADVLVVDYPNGYVVNENPLTIANEIELRIHEHWTRGKYANVILFGYSAGAALLRKAFVWGHGQEEDRENYGCRGHRKWVACVNRFVLLAGMNRGWSTDPKPSEMKASTYALFRVGQWVAHVFSIGGLVMSIRRGTPFMANTRLQWIRIARSQDVVEMRISFPQVIQIIGDQDDVVSKEDGQDLRTAAGAIFVNLSQTGHKDIVSTLEGIDTPIAQERRRKIELALQGRLEELDPAKPKTLLEDRSTSRIVFVKHGIRDRGQWTDIVRDEIRRRYHERNEKAEPLSPNYGYFPMARFLLHFDRQKKVRDFMDEYTEAVAKHPNVESIDYIGHSNGTYILGSALQRYAAMKVRRVFFAGSVLPSEYRWRELIEAGQVEKVINVVATGDWVVAFFPKLFEKLANQFGRKAGVSWMDLGSAGFDGFIAAGQTSAVDNLQYSRGAHSTGIDVENAEKLNAICSYIVDGQVRGLDVFENAKKRSFPIAAISEVCIFVWLLLLVVVLMAIVTAFNVGFSAGGIPLGIAALFGTILAVVIILYWI